MSGNVGNLFGKYSPTYSKVGEDGNVPLSQKELRKASRNELRGFDGEGLRVSKRGGNFLDRIVCWLEDRVFSLTRSGKVTSSRQERSEKFVEHVSDALVEIGVEPAGIKEHDLIRQIESVRKRDLPLRSGFVQSILREVASLEHASGQGRLPDIAKVAFPAEVVSSVQGSDAGKDMTHISYDESGSQISDDSGEADKNDLSLSETEMELEIHKAGGEDFMNLTAADFTEKLCQYAKGRLIGPSLDGELFRRDVSINPEQYNKVVSDTTLELAKRKLPSNEGEDAISGTMTYAKSEYDKIKNYVAQGVGNPVVMEEDALFETVFKICGDASESGLMSEVVSRNLDCLGVGVGEPHGNDVQGVLQPPPHGQGGDEVRQPPQAQQAKPLLNPASASSDKNIAVKAFAQKLEGSTLKNPVRTTGFTIIKQMGHGFDAVMNNTTSPVRAAYSDHTSGATWKNRHRQTAIDLYSTHYDAAAREGDISLSKVEETTMKEFMEQFKLEFRKALKEIKV